MFIAGQAAQKFKAPLGAKRCAFSHGHFAPKAALSLQMEFSAINISLPTEQSSACNHEVLAGGTRYVLALNPNLTILKTSFFQIGAVRLVREDSGESLNLISSRQERHHIIPVLRLSAYPYSQQSFDCFEIRQILRDE